MPIKLDCPRCKNSLVVPGKKAGGYATCPRCQGRFWVPEDSSNETLKQPAADAPATPPSPSLAVPPGLTPPPAQGMTAPLAAPPIVPVVAPPTVGPAPPPVAAPPNVVAPAVVVPPVVGPPPSGLTPGGPPPMQRPVVGPSHPGAVVKFGEDEPDRQPRTVPPPVVVAQPGIPGVAPVAPPVDRRPPAPAPSGNRKVARFITAQAAQSKLSVAADGKLPELKLGDAGDRPAKGSSSRGMNPLVVFGLLAVSVGASLLLLMMDTGAGPPTKGRARDDARQVIQENYFTDVDNQNGGAAKPYQRLLREALAEHARGRYKEERQLYRRVLDLLRVDPRPPKGITGSKALDERLEKQLIILLSE